MEEITFTLRPNDEFIELNKLLQVMEIAQTGGHAKLLIEDGAVKVNGEVEFRKRNKLRDGDKVAIDHLTITISK
ncbi:MAG: RNA-binding S4 domain-containing protein [Crocinitomicaceae bacterium]|nr:RNA-binding S4 domain-containing protein [Crocinitomicaceae bacterium]